MTRDSNTTDSTVETTDPMIKRRKLLAGAASATAVALAGCSGILSDDSTPTETGTPNGTDTESPTNTEPADNTTDTTSTMTPENTVPSEIETFLTEFYTVWAEANFEELVPHTHSFNKKRVPEQGIEFDGELTDLQLTLVKEDLTEDEIAAFTERVQEITDDEVTQLAEVDNLRVQANPTIEGEANSERATQFKESANLTKDHLLAIEDDEWKVVV